MKGCVLSRWGAEPGEGHAGAADCFSTLSQHSLSPKGATSAGGLSTFVKPRLGGMGFVQTDPARDVPAQGRMVGIMWPLMVPPSPTHSMMLQPREHWRSCTQLVEGCRTAAGAWQGAHGLPVSLSQLLQPLHPGPVSFSTRQIQKKRPTSSPWVEADSSHALPCVFGSRGWVRFQSFCWQLSPVLNMLLK